MSSEIVKVLETIVLAINKNYSFEDVERSLNLANKKKKTLIAAAYSWIYEKKLRDLYISKTLNHKSSRSFRVLSENEASAIGLQNYDYLLHFYNIGLLNISEIERIIDNIMEFPEDIRNRESINLLILSVILDIDRVSLPGSRYTLYSSDTIN
jgi:uncharacterized protein Smg (DUF494 family)